MNLFACEPRIPMAPIPHAFPRTTQLYISQRHFFDDTQSSADIHYILLVDTLFVLTLNLPTACSFIVILQLTHEKCIYFRN